MGALGIMSDLGLGGIGGEGRGEDGRGRGREEFVFPQIPSQNRDRRWKNRGAAICLLIMPQV